MRVRRLVLAAGVLMLCVEARAQSGIEAYVYASGFASPVAIAQDPTGQCLQFVVEQAGRIRSVRAGARVGDFLDIIRS